MTIKVAINGYGRIGRNILRAHYEGGKKHDIQIVAINDLGNAESNAHLTRYDTAHGKFPGTVAVEGDHMIVNGDKIRVFAQRNPAEIPWGELGVDVVLGEQFGVRLRYPGQHGCQAADRARQHGGHGRLLQPRRHQPPRRRSMCSRTRACWVGSRLS